MWGRGGMGGGGGVFTSTCPWHCEQQTLLMLLCEHSVEWTLQERASKPFVTHVVSALCLPDVTTRSPRLPQASPGFSTAEFAYSKTEGGNDRDSLLIHNLCPVLWDFVPQTANRAALTHPSDSNHHPLISQVCSLTSSLVMESGISIWCGARYIASIVLSIIVLKT